MMEVFVNEEGNTVFRLVLNDEEDVAQAFKQFIELSHLKQYHDARQIYYECFEPHPVWFPALAEYGEMLLREGLYQRLLHEVSGANLTDAKEKATIDLMRHFALFVVAMSSLGEKPVWANTDAQLKEHKYKLIERMMATLRSSWKDFGVDMRSSSPIDTEVSS